MVAKKDLTLEEYGAWAEEYQEARFVVGFKISNWVAMKRLVHWLSR